MKNSLHKVLTFVELMCDRYSMREQKNRLVPKVRRRRQRSVLLCSSLPARGAWRTVGHNGQWCLLVVATMSNACAAFIRPGVPGDTGPGQTRLGRGPCLVVGACGIVRGGRSRLRGISGTGNAITSLHEVVNNKNNNRLVPSSRQAIISSAPGRALSPEYDQEVPEREKARMGKNEFPLFQYLETAQSRFGHQIGWC